MNKLKKLSGKEWNNILVVEKTKDNIISRIIKNEVSEWGQEIIKYTEKNEKVLEIGAGTGEISLNLALKNRQVTTIDINYDNLNFIKKLSSNFNIKMNFIQADALCKLPISDNFFYCVWSSGLLEHFDYKERLLMIREQERISKRYVIAMTPNSSSFAYRAGKYYLEKNNKWRYGKETPIKTLKKEFVEAGLFVDNEYSIAIEQALLFLPKKHFFRKAVEKLIKEIPKDELNTYNQGYLLVTVGVVKK